VLIRRDLRDALRTSEISRRLYRSYARGSYCGTQKVSEIVRAIARTSLPSPSERSLANREHHGGVSKRGVVRI
jgi:hypothetical protein